MCVKAPAMNREIVSNVRLCFRNKSKEILTVPALGKRIAYERKSF